MFDYSLKSYVTKEYIQPLNVLYPKYETLYSDNILKIIKCYKYKINPTSEIKVLNNSDVLVTNIINQILYQVNLQDNTVQVTNITLEHEKIFQYSNPYHNLNFIPIGAAYSCILINNPQKQEIKYIISPSSIEPTITNEPFIFLIIPNGNTLSIQCDKDDSLKLSEYIYNHYTDRSLSFKEDNIKNWSYNLTVTDTINLTLINKNLDIQKEEFKITPPVKYIYSTDNFDFSYLPIH